MTKLVVKRSPVFEQAWCVGQQRHYRTLHTEHPMNFGGECRSVNSACLVRANLTEYYPVDIIHQILSTAYHSLNKARIASE